MFNEFLYKVEQMEEDDGEQRAKSDKAGDQRMAIYVNHSFQVSQGDRYRFPSNQFGYGLSNCSPYFLQDFTHVLNRYMQLEAYCDAVDDLTGALPKTGLAPNEPDLFQALFFPRSIAPRTPMNPVASTQMTEETLSAMWFRLVAHYFEWLAGISELQYLSDQDKLRLAVCQLCKVVCFSVVYANYHFKNDENDDLLFFGSGFYWDPARGNDPLMDDYCQEMKRIVNQVVYPLRKVGMVKEEFVLVKLILLFDCTSLMGLSDEGLEFTRSMCNKYRTTLSQYVRCHIEELADTEGWSQNEIDRCSMDRIKNLLDLPIGVEKLGKLDDDSLAEMVESNYGGMRGTLQQQIHTESRKVRNR
ncbi:NR LBD domain-containing protein [Caenorhabditis elegans]|uniref:NR LBD domain-containing protein n=1 Tax=Caenorhabditis elegans TaxID=6239 RepID=Q95XT8_CAEEL|nr:NR LBD domain-containing protein [Caenorhabditis elegans]CCD73141.2 NR LBD domain-containing protein [Caenorhabditis elegans]|eukprot:NP_500299.2 Uncharacterized protein CELE_Y67D8B.2 [Caenorhabditis elegans]